MLPKFPVFKKLELSDQIDIEKITSKYQPYSDFDFANMWAWDDDQTLEVSEINGNLALIIKDLVTDELTLSFLGKEMVNDCLEQLFNYLNSNESIGHIGLVPEISLMGIDLNKFMIEIDPNTSDYIYELSDLANYRGSRYASKRNLFNLFVHNYPDHQMKEIDLSEMANINKILELNKKWADKKNPQSSTTNFYNKETLALERVLKSKINSLICIGFEYQENLIGFSVISLTKSSYAVGLFSKYDANYTGLNEYMMNKVAKLLLDKGYKYLNAEEDLGLDGLRFSKNSFRPTGFLRKYFVKMQ